MPLIVEGWTLSYAMAVSLQFLVCILVCTASKIGTVGTGRYLKLYFQTQVLINFIYISAEFVRRIVVQNYFALLFI